MSKTRLTPLGKLVLIVLGFGLVATLGAAGASADRPHAKEWRCVSVLPGDTLWELAWASTDGDTREALHRIVEVNGLRGKVLQPGAAVWVPRDGSAATLGDRTVAAERCPSVG